MDEGKKAQALQRYDDLADRHEAAYVSFERIYTRQHPQPEKPKSQGVDRVITSALVFLVIASVIVSGSRTVFEFGGGLVGGSAFVMLELGIIGYAYISAKRDDRNHARSVKRLTKAGITMAFIVALSANIHATLKSGGIVIDPVIDTVILLFVAVSAPTLAYIAGELLGIETVSGERRQSLVMTGYDKSMEEWRDGLNRAFASKRGDLGVRVEVENVTQPALPAVSSASNGHVGQNGHENKRPSIAALKVRGYLETNPDDAERPVRELAELIGVSKSTVSSVLAQWRDEQQDQVKN